MQITEHLGINRDTELFGLIPALTPGTYKLEVVTTYTRGGSSLKDARVITAEPVLTVA